MASLSRSSLLQRASPVAVMAMRDAPDDYGTQGARIIMGLGDQAGRHAKTEAALATFRGGAATAEANGGAVSRTLVSVAEKTGLRAAGRYGALAVPVAGEAIAGSMLAYDVWKLGYRAVTGQSFETTSVGRAVTRASDGAWHAGLGVAGGMMDKLGMSRAAGFTRGWLSEAITGTAVDGPAPASKQATGAAPAAARGGDAGTEMVPGGSPGDAPGKTVLTPGPSRRMTFADWDEPAYVRRGPETIVTTTPLRRAFATMDLLVADVGLPATERYAEVGPASTPAARPAPRPSRSAGEGLE